MPVKYYFMNGLQLHEGVAHGYIEFVREVGFLQGTPCVDFDIYV